MAAAKEACRKAEEENGGLTDEQLSMLMELGAIKEDFAAFREKSFAEKLALEAEFDASSNVISTMATAAVLLRTIYVGASP